jgi:hypothetical protein
LGGAASTDLPPCVRRSLRAELVSSCVVWR